MTLAEIRAMAVAEYGNRYQITPAQFQQYFNIVQTMAYAQDLEAFKDYSNTLTILQKLGVASFSPAIVAGDVGKAVVGATSGATGTLAYYGSDYIAVDSEDTFTDGEAFTITTGTGAGTLESDDAQEVYKGPYNFPTSPLVRKLLGITKATDSQLFGVETTLTGDDYGMVTQFNLDKIWERVRISSRGPTRTLTFIEAPSVTEAYRWVYYIRPPVIAGIAAADDLDLWIPLEYHWSLFYQAVIALADNATYGDKQPEELLKPYMDPFWESMRAHSTPMGGLFNYGISEGQP